jgi:hypothetical protein
MVKAFAIRQHGGHELGRELPFQPSRLIRLDAVGWSFGVEEICEFSWENYCGEIAKGFDVTSPIVYSSCTFDENLHEHINGDLADNVGRESDTS